MGGWEVVDRVFGALKCPTVAQQGTALKRL